MSELDKRIEENEERLRLAIESTQLGTWEYYPLTGELHWSPECRKIYGLLNDQEVDMSVFDEHIYEDDKQHVIQQIEEAMNPAGNGAYDVIYRITRFDDHTIRWIHPKGKVYFNEKRQPERFIGTVVDITEYKAFEESLRESEQRARIAIEAAELGTFDWDIAAGNYYSSPRVMEIFGYGNQKDVTHDDLVSRFHPQDKPIRDKAVKESIDKGGLMYEVRVVWSDQTIRWIKVYGKIIPGIHREVRRMYGIVMDITEQKSQEAMLEKLVAERTLSLMQSNEELKKSEERYSKMAEEVQDYAILLLSTEGFILNWNKGAERIKGYHESEIIGKHFRIFYLPDDRENRLPETLLREATETGRAMHEGWRIRKDSTIFWGSIVITALHDAENNIIGFTKVTRDLTERKMAEEQLQQYNRELEAQNKELEQFAYIASHDLQEPLRKIQTFTEILEKNITDEPTARKYLERITSSAHRMSQLVRAVLDYSRLSVSEIVLEPVDLDSVLDNVKNDLELPISERGAEIVSQKLPVVKGIPIQLHQLFLNLLSNAIKFSDRAPKIRISSRSLPSRENSQYAGLQPGMEYAEIIVEDQGIGFEQKYASRIFTIFQRLHGQKAYPGTGIGLALCKKIVDNHYGHIHVESEPGKGSRFFIYLLVAQK
jgi:PAS domain S-box-containing protein